MLCVVVVVVVVVAVRVVVVAVAVVVVVVIVVVVAAVVGGNCGVVAVVRERNRATELLTCVGATSVSPIKNCEHPTLEPQASRTNIKLDFT